MRTFGCAQTCSTPSLCDYPLEALLSEGSFEELVVAVNEFEQLARDVRVFATEVRTLGYSSVASGHENQFLELSERMTRRVDGLNRLSN